MSGKLRPTNSYLFSVAISALAFCTVPAGAEEALMNDAEALAVIGMVVDPVARGHIDSHYATANTPFYGLVGKYFDALLITCPQLGGINDKTMRIQRELGREAFGLYSALSRIEATADATVLSFSTQLNTRLAEVGMERLALERMFAERAAELAVRTVDYYGGKCDDPNINRLAKNLAAIGTFGSIERSAEIESKWTLVEPLWTGDGQVLFCRYDDDLTTLEAFQQRYEALTAPNLLALQFLSGGELVFLRSGCPASPDPHFPLENYVRSPILDASRLGTGDFAEKRAELFLGQQLPAVIKQHGWDFIDADEIEEARGYIVALERFEVSEEEVIEQILKRRQRDIENRVPEALLPDPARARDRHLFEWRLRWAKYREEKGDFDIEIDVDRIIASYNNHRNKDEYKNIRP